jgi:pimeloyl-ACP methyl ester carboxylesterase
MPFVRRADDTTILDLYYEANGSGEPVVLIGGLTSTLELWAQQVPALAARYRVITPDNRGSGRSTVMPDDGDRSIATFAADLLFLLDALELERVRLVGASMGGMIAQEFALRYGDRLVSLCVACSHAGGPEVVAAEPAAVQALVRGSGDDATAAERSAALRVAFHERTLVDNPAAITGYEESKRRWPHARDEVTQRVTAVSRWRADDRLTSLRVPTLYLTGDSDQLVPPENSRRLAARVPHAELAIVERAGHVFMCERPAATNQILLEWFGRHSGTEAIRVTSPLHRVTG